MKQYLPTVLVLVCAVLAVSLFAMKRSGHAQHESDAGTIADFSNRLDSAQLDVAFCRGTMFTLSNRLDHSQLAVLAFSNQLMAAESAATLAAGQITNLTRQVAEMVKAESKRQALQSTLRHRVMELTNQVTGLTQQLASAQAGLHQAHKDYALLEKRLRQDVAARLVVERKFNNLAALKAQIQYLEWSPAREISSDRIYAGLDVEVNSNGAFHVLAPD